MNGYLIIMLNLLTFASSCSNDARTIYLKAERVDGVSSESIVSVNGYQIGQVDDILVNTQGDVIIQLRLDKDPLIPMDSKFLIESRDLFGTKEILVQLGKSGEYFAHGDTIMSVAQMRSPLNDSLATKLDDIVSNLTGSKQRDSILYELRRLNRNLEELKNDKESESSKASLSH